MHRWLGVRWPVDLVFLQDLYMRLALASAAFSKLSGLVSAGAVPIAWATRLFESKVDSILVLSRWLWLGVPGLAAILDRQQENWARGLIGAATWRNPAVASSEVGWLLSGHDRAVKEVALRRARLWRLPATDIYGRAGRSGRQ